MKASAQAKINLMLAMSTRHPLERIPSSFSGGPRWYVFCCAPKTETAAGDYIKTQLGYETFVPLLKKRIHRPLKANRQSVILPLFSRYGFVRFDINEAGWGQIVEVKEVSSLLSSAESIPISVPNGEIETLQRAEKIGLFNEDNRPKPGDVVQILKDPYSNIIGKLVRIRDDGKISWPRTEERADIMIEFLGSQRVVTTYLGNLQAVER